MRKWDINGVLTFAKHVGTSTYKYRRNPNNNIYKGGDGLIRGVNERQMAEKIWLHYYNQELYRRSVITESERNKMALRIESRKPLYNAKNNRCNSYER